MSKEKLQKLFYEVDKLFQEEKWGAVVAKYDEIISLLEGVVADDVKAKVYSNRSNAKNKMGDYEGAIADCDQALKINPQDVNAYINRGNAKHFMGNHEGAIADYDQALAIDPQLVGAYNNRGKAKGDMGDHKGAIADLDHALTIDPQDAEVYNNRGNTKGSMGDYESAIADFDQALTIDPKFVKAYNNRGNAKDRMGDHKGAVADCDRALEIDPENVTAYSTRGNAKNSMGDYESAIADYDRVLEIDPENKKTIHNRAIALAMQASQKEREEFLGKYRAQTKKEFESNLKAGKDLLKQEEHKENLDDYTKQARRRGGWVWFFSIFLAAAAVLIFGRIACIGFQEWQAAQSPMAMRVFSPLSLFPFILMGTLVLSPLVWIIRMLNRDKHKYWALREDALANLMLVRIIKSDEGRSEKLWLQLFDHYDKRGSAHLIADWKHSDTSGGNNFTINPGDKP